MSFNDVKVGSIISVHVEGQRKLAVVEQIVERELELAGEKRWISVAVTRGNMQFRLDTGVALVPPKAWLIQRHTPAAARRLRLQWAYGEQPE
jgi:hypothetical protein